jgi:hypothetical protein
MYYAEHALSIAGSLSRTSAPGLLSAPSSLLVLIPLLSSIYMLYSIRLLASPVRLFLSPPRCSATLTVFPSPSSVPSSAPTSSPLSARWRPRSSPNAFICSPTPPAPVRLPREGRNPSSSLASLIGIGDERSRGSQGQRCGSSSVLLLSVYGVWCKRRKWRGKLIVLWGFARRICSGSSLQPSTLLSSRRPTTLGSSPRFLPLLCPAFL